jgi:hypothetical protein
MAPEDVVDNLYLVYLSLAACRLETWPEIILPNLNTLDLSYNLITEFSFKPVFAMGNLLRLSLKGNPLVSFPASTSSDHLPSLLSLDLSLTRFATFDSGELDPVINLETLNLSHSRITTITENGFVKLKQLVAIDLTGNNIGYFPMTVFGRLSKLQIVSTENYRLCCKSILPEGFNLANCISPLNTLSSCENLFRSNSHRVFLWVIGFVSLISNIIVCVSVCWGNDMKTHKYGHSCHMLNLCLSNCVNAFYPLSVSVADAWYLGVYLDYERGWESSAMCKILGVMFVMSYEVSVFILSLLAVEGILTLQVPPSTVRFTGRSSVLSAAFAWFLGLLLALVPLLPALAHWNFYGHTGICIPTLGIGQGDQGRDLFAILTTCCVVLMLMATVCVKMAERTPTEPLIYERAADRGVTQRVWFITTGDLLCKIPICVLGLTSVSGIDVPDEVGLTVTVCLLPLSAALSPVLYTYRLLVETRQRQHQSRIAQLLEKEKSTALKTQKGPARMITKVKINSD